MAKLVKHRLERLREQREKLNARIQSVEARVKTSERKQDVRKKILIGAYYLDQAEKNNAMSELKSIMNKFLKRDFDRELFGLEPLSKKD
ncbi:MAG: mobilization protein [bacterium]